MVVAAKQRRRTPATVWRAARALYASDPRLTLQLVAERFDLSLHAVRKRSSRERWRERSQKCAEGSREAKSEVAADVVPVVTLSDFRKAVQQEAVAFLCLLRQARRTAEHDPIEAIRAIVPTLERLGRIAEAAFEPAEPEYGIGCKKSLLHPLVLYGLPLPPRVSDGDKGAK